MLLDSWQVFAELEKDEQPEVALVRRDRGGLGVDLLKKGDRMVEGALDVVEAELFPETKRISVGF